MTTNSSQYMKSYYAKEKKKVIQLLGGKCKVCGAVASHFYFLRMSHDYFISHYCSKQATGWDKIKYAKEVICWGFSSDIILRCNKHKIRRK